ncbi:MAG: LemA family protein [Cephaloticoccus sp.]|nr:LemA family protein [Cephaloticoccus sp.]MCF7759667.1 LemA family protein [Cephaloticoccus sp.]
MQDYVGWLIGGVIACGLCLWGNLRELRRRRLLTDTPTSKALGVFIGMSELKGTAEAEQPLTSFLAELPNVIYNWCVEESWSRIVTETYTDKDGKSRTRTRRENGWTTVAQGGDSIPFYLQDDTGVVLVRPEGAKLELTGFFAQTVGRGDPLYYAKAPRTAVPHSDGRRRFIEQGIPLHAPLYVIGPARERTDVVAPEIAANREAEIFLISTRGEDKVQATMGRWAWFWGLLGLLIVCLPLLMMVAGRQYLIPVKLLAWVGLPPLTYALLWGLGWVWMVFNQVVGLRQRVRQGWSLIEVQLQRRHDLIPRLAAGLSGLSAHEKEVQTAVTQLRLQYEATAPGAAGPDFAGLAGTLRVVAERYPAITAQAGFANLQKELVETEQRIALARSYYNDIATYFANRLEIIPDRWVAALVQMKPEPLFRADDFERAPVTVKFA